MGDIMTEIKIVRLKGDSFHITVDLENTVEELKNQIGTKIEVDPTSIKLIYRGKVLSNDKKLKE